MKIILYIYGILLLVSYAESSVWSDISNYAKSMFHDFRGIFTSKDDSVISSFTSKVSSILNSNSGLLCYGFTSYCCDSTFTGDIKGLEKSLILKLHGQHLVIDIVTKALKSHVWGQPRKALVLSFHGWTGGGKNFVTNEIVDYLFEDGMKSPFVHLFISTLHFPHPSKIETYQDNLVEWIKSNVSICDRSVFIFDEMDKMPPGVIDAIKPFIDYHYVVDGYSFAKTIFIFISNTGGLQLTKLAYNYWKDGRKRTEITVKDVEKLLMNDAFNEPSGLQDSRIVAHSLVDFYIPFLPLERDHVKLCAKDEVVRRNGRVSEKLLDDVADNMLYYPPNALLFSTSGCKLVSKKIDLLLEW